MKSRAPQGRNKPTMLSLSRLINNLTLFILFLLFFLLIFADRIALPVWLQVTGRFHPVILHIPIGLAVFTVILLFFQSTFKKKQFRKILLMCLGLLAVSTSFTALLGLFLSVGGDYGPDALKQHKLGGVAASVLAYIAMVGFQYDKGNRLIVYGGPWLLLITCIYVGHTGAILTHGENFLWSPLMTSAREWPDTAKQSVYQLAVMPVLEKKCFSCHNESKAKGKLIMTSEEKFSRGGKRGREWQEGEPDSSRLLQFIHLPIEHDDHMPPDGKPQLSSFEISLLEAWVRSGASFSKRMSEFDATDTLVALAQQVLKASRSVPGIMYSFKPAPLPVIEKLNTPTRPVFPLFQGSPALQADFFIKEFFQISALEELREVNEQLVVLNLSKMPVDDKALAIIAGFKNVEKLNLNFTAINGSGLVHLASLSRLRSLALSGTAVTKESLTAVLSIPNLKEIFIWNTPITEEEKAALEKSYPSISFIHTLYKDQEIVPLSKPVLVNEEGVIRRGERVQLRHNMPGVVIRYAFNERPDSVAGLIYDKPLEINEPAKLQAIACKPGWYCSGVMEDVLFIEGIKPEAVALLTLPDKQYPGEGAASLIDGKKGFPDIFKEPSWLGYRDHALEAGFDFGSNPPALKKVVLSYGENLGAFIFPPAEVEVWGGENKNGLKLLSKMKTELPSGYRSQRIEPLTILLNGSTYSYYKLIARPIASLPKWHNGKGKKGWVFVDEVFFY
jgi:uncharacterized membrane protein